MYPVHFRRVRFNPHHKELSSPICEEIVKNEVIFCEDGSRKLALEKVIFYYIIYPEQEEQFHEKAIGSG